MKNGSYHLFHSHPRSLDLRSIFRNSEAKQNGNKAKTFIIIIIIIIKIISDLGIADSNGDRLVEKNKWLVLLESVQTSSAS